MEAFRRYVVVAISSDPSICHLEDSFWRAQNMFDSSRWRQGWNGTCVVKEYRRVRSGAKEIILSDIAMMVLEREYRRANESWQDIHLQNKMFPKDSTYLLCASTSSGLLAWLYGVECIDGDPDPLKGNGNWKVSIRESFSPQISFKREI